MEDSQSGPVHVPIAGSLAWLEPSIRWRTLWPVMVSGDIDKCSAMVEEVFQVKDLFFKLLVIRFTSSRDRLCS
jgi:hypothetical protein